MRDQNEQRTGKDRDPRRMARAAAGRIGALRVSGLDIATLWRGLRGADNGIADRVVPPTGHTAQLTVLTAAAMAFLAVFALALTLATGRLAERWSEGLAQSATVRVTAPDADIDTRSAAVIEILRATPGVTQPEVVPADQVATLLEPWFGPDIPVDALPIPRLIALTTGKGFDADALRQRLAGEVPGAVLDDHTAWRKPLVSAARRLRALGWMSLLLIGGVTTAMMTLAARSALAANGQVIAVLRLIGARDLTIATAFVRRFTRRAGLGAAAGTLAGMIAVLALPSMDAAGGFLTGLGFSGAGWLWPLLIPPIFAAIGFLATRRAALRMLQEVR